MHEVHKILTCVRPQHLFTEFAFFFFQAEDGIRDLVRSRGLGDVYKRQCWVKSGGAYGVVGRVSSKEQPSSVLRTLTTPPCACLLYTSDAADERSSVDLGGRRIIKKKNTADHAHDRQWSTKEKDGQNNYTAQ